MLQRISTCFNKISSIDGENHGFHRSQAIDFLDIFGYQITEAIDVCLNFSLSSRSHPSQICIRPGSNSCKLCIVTFHGTMRTRSVQNVFFRTTGFLASFFAAKLGPDMAIPETKSFNLYNSSNKMVTEDTTSEKCTSSIL